MRRQTGSQTGSKVRAHTSLARRTLRALATLLPLAVLLLAPAGGAASPGSLDTTFGGDGIANGPYGEGYSVTVAPDGKVVVAGCSDVCGGPGEDFTVGRFNSAGALDTSFGRNGVVRTDIGGDDFAHAVAIQPNPQRPDDYKIVVAGCTGCDWFGASDFALARYNSDGTLDGSFGRGGKVTTDFMLGTGFSTDLAYGVAVQPDGKIVAGGFSDNRFALARYNADGSLDSKFGPGLLGTGLLAGTVTTSFDRGGALGFALALDRKARIVLAGSANGKAAVARYLPSGALDGAFSGDGKATIDFDASYRAVQGVAIQGDNKVVVAGEGRPTEPTNANAEDFVLARFTEAGVPDSAFGTGGKVVTDFGSSTAARNDVGTGVAVQPDGKIVAAGYSFDNQSMNLALARYTGRGALDSTFGSGGKVLSVGGWADDVALQNDGKILLGGVAMGPFAAARYLP